MPKRHPLHRSVIRPLLLTQCGLLLVLTGCSGSEQAAPSTAPVPAATVTVTETASAPAQTSSAAAPVAALDAEARLARLVAVLPQVSQVMVYDAANDPNDLLGRPGGYTSKVAFADSRVPAEDVASEDADALKRGGSIEVFPDAAAAKARSDYIQSIVQGATMLGTEYHYLDGGALLRVSGILTPEEAATYETAWTVQP